MAEIRVNKLMRQFNIGLDTLVSFLRTQGVWVEEHPNAKVPDTVLPALHKKFGHDKEMAEAASKTAVRISTIVGDNKGKKKVVAQEKKHQPISTQRTRKPSPKPENSTIPIAPQREYAKRVKIKAINRPHRIITDGFDGFKAGVLFPKDILYKGQPIAIANAEALINSRFRVGDIIHCRVVGTSPDRHIAYLSCEISGFNLSGLDGFETVAPGAKYPVRLIGTSNNYFIVAIVGTQIRGLVLKNQFEDGADMDKRGNIRLQLVEKPENPFQFARFVKPIAVTPKVAVDDIDPIVESFLTEPELDAITPEDLDIVRSILLRYPDLKRKKADQITGIQLYCCIPEVSRLHYFLRQEPDYFTKHTF